MKRVAVIGLGDRGMAHAKHLSNTPHAGFAAVVEQEPIRAKRAAKKFRCQALGDARALSVTDTDCAVLAAPLPQQFAIATWLLNNGMDVLLDHPFVESPGQLRQLIALARKNGLVLQIGHREAFCSALDAVANSLKDPRFFEVRRIVPWAKANPGTDVVMDLMLEDILLVTRLLGRAVKRVEAIGVPVVSDSVDIANARVTFVGGVVANFSASRAAARAERTIRIFQPDLYLSLDFGQSVVKFNRKTCAQGVAEFASEQFVFDQSAALAAEIESFIACCEHRKPAKVDAEAGVVALEVVEKVRAAFHASFAELDDPALTVRYGNFLG